MDRQLKQRVVGAALLVAFGVVFIPIFLDNDALDEAIPPAFELPPPPTVGDGAATLPLDAAQIEALEHSIDAPPAPPEPAPDRAAPSAVDATATADSAAPAPSAAAPAPAPPTPEGAAADATAWAVQLGSFASEQNARSLVAKLAAAGRQAYVEPRSETGTTVFKVRVGPLASRAAAEHARAELERDYATRGMLMPYP